MLILNLLFLSHCPYFMLPCNKYRPYNLQIPFVCSFSSIQLMYIWQKRQFYRFIFLTLSFWSLNLPNINAVFVFQTLISRENWPSELAHNINFFLASDSELEAIYILFDHA